MVVTTGNGVGDGGAWCGSGGDHRLGGGGRREEEGLRRGAEQGGGAEEVVGEAEAEAMHVGAAAVGEAEERGACESGRQRRRRIRSRQAAVA